MPRENPTPNQAVPRKADDFFFDYANFVQLENSPWDLKFTFGQLDQATKPPTTELRSAVTMPWLSAKILAFFLIANVKGFEQTFGPIIVPPEIAPQPFPPPTEEQLKSAPNLREFAAEMERFRKEFFNLPDSDV